MTARGDWIKAKDLNIGDQLDDVDDGQALLESTEWESHPDGIPVFNFEVEDFHNYYVRAHGSRGPPILVHNADGYDILQTQILHITSPGINGLPGTGVFRDGVGSIYGSQYEPDIVYRALRREEIPAALENGLVAKNVNANFSPLDHVVDGSTEGFQSQFI